MTGDMVSMRDIGMADVDGACKGSKEMVGMADGAGDGNCDGSEEIVDMDDAVGACVGCSVGATVLEVGFAVVGAPDET